MKLAYRVLVIFLGPITIIGAVGTAVTVEQLRARILRERTLELARSARLLGLQWTPSADPLAVAAAASAAIDGRVTLLDHQGRVVATAPRGQTEGNAQLRVTVPSPQGVVMMAVSTSPMDRILSGVKSSAMIAAGIALGWALLCTVFFSRYISKPVIQLGDMARSLARREFAGSPPINAPDEVGDLADSLFQLSDRLHALERARSDFITNVSHELCSPLTIVSGFASTLARNDPPAEARQEFANAILSNATRMQRVIDDMLDLSRIESGRWIPAFQRLNVPELVEESLASFRAAAAVKRISLVADLDEDARAFEADPTAARQTILNLLENAIRHTHSGTISVSSRRENEGVWLRVSDTGEGISDEHLPRIFERFYRVDDGRARGTGGTGLGLAIVKHMAEAHGGRVEVRSKLGEGTTIGVLFPQPPIRRSATPAAGSQQVADIVTIRT